MRRFLLEENKVAKVLSVTTTIGAGTTSTDMDTDTYVDAEGFENICVLARIESVADAPATVKLQLMAASASGGTGATTVTTASWALPVAKDVAALHAPVNVKGVDFHYFAVKLTAVGTATSDKIAARTLYFLGGARHLPIGVTTLTANVDATKHVTTVKKMPIATA